jgi:hypothetical protein
MLVLACPGGQKAQVVGAVDQVQVAPLLGREVAEERRRLQLPLMHLKPLDYLLEPRHGSGFIAAGCRERPLRSRDALLHAPLFEDATKYEPSEQDLEQPWHPEREAVQRTLYEVGQVVTDLGKVPLPKFLVPALMQPVHLGMDLGKVVELKLSLSHVYLAVKWVVLPLPHQRVERPNRGKRQKRFLPILFSARRRGKGFPGPLLPRTEGKSCAKNGLTCKSACPMNEQTRQGLRGTRNARRMFPSLTRTGSRLLRSWRGLFLCFLALLLAVDDNARWHFALDSTRAGAPSAPDGADGEEALVKHAHHSGAHRCGTRRKGQLASAPREPALALLATHDSSPAPPRHSPPVRSPSAVHALVSPLRC